MGVLRHLLVIAAVAAGLITLAPPATVDAQGFRWPWEDDEPVRPRPRPRPQPQWNAEPRPAPQAPGTGPTTPGQSWNNQAWGNRSPVCLQLEQRLVQETQQGSSARARLPEINQRISELKQDVRRSESGLDRSNCYEYFLFSKTLRSTKRCLNLSRRAEKSRRELAELENERMNIEGSSASSYQDEIIRELARNNCGSDYVREARRRDRGSFQAFWDDEETGGYQGQGNTYNSLPFATYRTMCVRLCDGYYFPVSFSTLPNHFQRDAEVCQSKCAAPAELFYYQNPGSSVEQMVSAADNRPYTQLEAAFKYRKSYTQGCSCKQAEYVPQTPVPGQGTPSQRQGQGQGQRQGQGQHNAAGGVVQRRAEARDRALDPTR